MGEDKRCCRWGREQGRLSEGDSGVLDVLQGMVLTKGMSRGLQMMTRDCSDMNEGCIWDV